MAILTQARPSTVRQLSRVKHREVSSFCFGLYIYFLIDFFLHLSQRIPGYGVVRPTLLLVLLITMSLLMQRDVLKGRGQDKPFRIIVVLSVYFLISVPFVEWPGSVLKNNIPEFVKAVVFLFFTALTVDSERRLKVFLIVFLGCQVFRVLEPLYLNITTGYWGSKTHLSGGEFASRLAGAPSDVINPNELGFVIATVIPFLYYFLWQGRVKSKLFFVLLMLPLLYALALTMSRGAMVALLVVFWMIFKESNKKVFLICALMAGALVFWSNLSPVQKDRYLSLVSKESQANATVEGRFEGMRKEFELGLRRPIFGHGLGTTGEAKAHVYGKTQAAHNLYAEVLIETGIIGFIIFLAFMKSIFGELKKNKEYLAKLHSGNNFYLRLNTSLIAVFWMYAVYSINYWGLSVYYWYLLAGVVICTGRLLKNQVVVDDYKSETSHRYRMS